MYHMFIDQMYYQQVSIDTQYLRSANLGVRRKKKKKSKVKVLNLLGRGRENSLQRGERVGVGRRGWWTPPSVCVCWGNLLLKLLLETISVALECVCWQTYTHTETRRHTDTHVSCKNHRFLLRTWVVYLGLCSVCLKYLKPQDAYQCACRRAARRLLRTRASCMHDSH